MVFRTIFELFKKEVDNLKNVQRIDISSAIELEEYQKENLKNKLTQKLNKEVIFDEEKITLTFSDIRFAARFPGNSYCRPDARTKE